MLKQWLNSAHPQRNINRVLRWFEETQAPSLRSCSPPSPPLCSSPSSQPPTPISPVCHFPDWFHGTISRREAQNSLDSEDPGTFLVRVCGNRFGFSVSVKTSVCVLHHVVTQMDTGKYVLIGSPKVHTNLKSLVQYHHKASPLDMEHSHHMWDLSLMGYAYF